jgi:hypothetical protein
MEDRKRHGKGELNYINGNKYDGNWIYDKRIGQGKYSYIDGASYEGQWEIDKFNGQGRCLGKKV